MKPTTVKTIRKKKFPGHRFSKKQCQLFICILVLSGFANQSAFAAPPYSAVGKKQLPTISIAEGIMSFIGDAGYSHFNEPFLARNGFQIEVQKYSDTRVSFSLFLLSGKVFANEKTINRQLNFQTGILSEGLQVRYDFISKKNPQQVMIPFITAGIEYVVFNPKADLKDANGITYHYWSDGSIHNLAESDPNAGESVIVYRDYVYETEMKDANIDGFTSFNTSSIGIPIGIGARFKISNRCSMHFSSVCHFTNTDLIDAVTSESSGSRQGNTKNDKFIYSSVSFRYDLSSARQYPHKSKRKKPLVDVTNVNYEAIALDDADHDGVPDVDDEAGLNPENTKVDATGKPLDSDSDGIPDYRDKEVASSTGALVNENGVTITDEMIDEKYRRDSLATLPPDVVYIKSVDRLSPAESSFLLNADQQNLLSKYTPIPGVYQKIDIDLNGVITSAEISQAIDNYLTGKSTFTTEEFYKLIDFFFSQK